MNDQPTAATPAKPAPQFKKGDIVLRAQTEPRQPTKHKVVAGPVKAGNYDECYVLEGHPALVPVHVLTPFNPTTETAPDNQSEPEVLGTINAGNPPA